METVIKVSAKDKVIMAGTGRESTKQSIIDTKEAAVAGAHFASLIAPSFFAKKMTDQVLLSHFRQSADASPIPVLLYNNPGRTGVNISPDFVVRASKVDNIVGIKDSSGDLTITAEYIRRTDEKFSVLAGRDTLIYGTLCYGGKGAIAATANVAPKIIVEIYEAFQKGDLKRSLEAQFRLAPLRLAFDLGTFPVVIKEALNLIGIDAGVGIPPVGGIKPEAKKELKEILKNMGLLK